MRFYAGIFIDYLKTYMKTRMTYRSDFIIEIITDLLFQGMSLLLIFVVFLHTEQLGGWSRDEMVFIYGYFMLAYGLFTCIFNLWGFTERYIVKGEMDRVLTRPAHNLAQLLLENMDPASLFGALTGAIIMGVSWFRLGLDFGILELLVLVVLVISSVMIYGGVYIFLTAISFFSDAPTGIMPMIWNIQNYGRYPINIYNRAIQILLTWILPFAFVGVYPASWFLENKESARLALLTPVVGIVFLTIGYTFWNFGVRRYRGAGS